MKCLNCKVRVMASLDLNESWIDDDAIKGLTLGEIKKLSMELTQEDLGAFYEDAKWNVSVEYKPTEVEEKNKNNKNT